MAFLHNIFTGSSTKKLSTMFDFYISTFLPQNVSKIICAVFRLQLQTLMELDRDYKMQLLEDPS